MVKRSLTTWWRKGKSGCALSCNVSFNEDFSLQWLHSYSYACGSTYLKPKDVHKGWFWVKTPLELDILRKLYYLHKGDWLFLHTFCLLICRLNAYTTEWICMQLSRYVVNGPKSHYYVLVGIWVMVCIQKPSHHFFHTFRPLHMFTGSACRRICILCQQASPKHGLVNMTMTSNCNITNSAHQIQMTTICHWMKPPHKNFLRTPLLKPY